MSVINDTLLTDLLPKYYKRLFPYYLMSKWLGYSEVQKEYFQHREFSFTLKDDIYLRYMTFTDYNEFEKELQKRVPFKIDIGGVYNHIPKDSKQWIQGQLQVEERELVFDIDITDYDDVRFCCSGSAMCAKCWPLMQFAIRILDRALEEDFGLEHRFWVYSGRRGVHCWVADECARKLNQAARSGIAEYLTVVKGGEANVKKVALYQTLHPSIRRAIRIIEKDFVEYACNQQDFLGDDNKISKVLSLIPQDLREDCSNSLRKGKNSAERWALFKTFLPKQLNNKKVKMSPHIIEEVMLQYCYPRLDSEVTKGMNHLLKSPFCVHPKTGNVCVPIDAEKVEDFDPFKVPTIVELNEQLDRCDMISTDRKIKDYKKTDLKSYVEIFEKFLNKLEKTWKGKNIEQSDLKGLEGDF